MIKLLQLLKEQRKYFIRTADGNKIISNYIIYNSLEDEIIECQRKIGTENRRELNKNPEYVEYIKRRGKRI